MIGTNGSPVMKSSQRPTDRLDGAFQTAVDEQLFGRKLRYSTRGSVTSMTGDRTNRPSVLSAAKHWCHERSFSSETRRTSGCSNLTDRLRKAANFFRRCNMSLNFSRRDTKIDEPDAVLNWFDDGNDNGQPPR